jgi:hypothetical protein
MPMDRLVARDDGHRRGHRVLDRRQPMDRFVPRDDERAAMAGSASLSVVGRSAGLIRHCEER